MGRQLNIRNDDAYRLAHDLADRLCVPVTEAVTRALRDYAARIPTPAEMTPSQRAEVQAIRAIVRKYRRRIDPAADSSGNHDWLYDEQGLPK